MIRVSLTASTRRSVAQYEAHLRAIEGQDPHTDADRHLVEAHNQRRPVSTYLRRLQLHCPCHSVHYSIIQFTSFSTSHSCRTSIYRQLSGTLLRSLSPDTRLCAHTRWIQKGAHCNGLFLAKVSNVPQKMVTCPQHNTPSETFYCQQHVIDDICARDAGWMGSYGI